MTIKTVVKLGGSITERGTLKQIMLLGKTLSSLFEKRKDFMVVPGGGIFADFVRETQKKYGLDDKQAHWMAVQAMEQHANLLLNFIPNAVLYDFSAKDYSSAIFEKLPILRVMKFMRTESELERNWDSTSDAIAAEIALKAKAKEIVFLKDVDGVFVNKKSVKKITVQELSELESSPLDANTPGILHGKDIKVFIINGLIHDRIENLLEGKEFIGTEVVC
jgi:aspartokinase-like uncharacterized kinase